MSARKKPAKPRHSVTVEVAGERHVLRSDVSPDYTRAVAAHLDGVIRALPGFPSLEPHRATLLAALAITDELFRARQEASDAAERVRALAEELQHAATEGTAGRDTGNADAGEAPSSMAPAEP